MVLTIICRTPFIAAKLKFVIGIDITFLLLGEIGVRTIS